MKKGEYKKMEQEQDIQSISRELSDGFVSGVFDLYEKSQLQNVAIFVDYDNVYHTLMKHYLHDPNHVDPEKNLFVQLWNKYGRDNVRTFRAYADFEQLKSNLTSLQKKRIQIRHVYGNGRKETERKNSSDIELCIDAIESTYRDKNIGTYVFVTADSDMIPIMSRLMYKRKRVELFYVPAVAREEITYYAHEVYDLRDILKIEERDYNLDDYILPALQEIVDWIPRNQGKKNWLGGIMLIRTLTSKLQIPEIYISDLIEKMEIEKLIAQKSIYIDDKPKKEYYITPKGEALLTQKSVASGKNP